MKNKKGILPIFIALIVVGSLGFLGAGFSGFQISRSAKFSKAADLAFANGNYSEATALYERALTYHKTKDLKERKNIAEKEKNFALVLGEGKILTDQSNWQGCLDKLSSISSDSKSFTIAQSMILACQTKVDEAAAAKKKAEEEAAAAEAAKSKTVNNISKKSTASVGGAQSTPSASPEPAAPPPVEDPTKCKSNANPVFTNHIIDLNTVTGILPPPNIAQPSGHLKTHSYITTTASGIPLYAPVDMVLIKGDYYTNGPYTLDFRVTCEVMLRVAHVTEPIAAIKEAFGTDPDAAPEIVLSSPIVVKAGELFAYTGGPPHVMSMGLDFGVYNSTKPNKYVDSQTSSIYTTAVCPYDYFSSELKSAYQAKFYLAEHQGMVQDGDSFCQ